MSEHTQGANPENHSERQTDSHVDSAFKYKRIVGTVAVHAAMTKDDFFNFLEANGAERDSDISATPIRSEDFELESRILVFGIRLFVLRSLTPEAINTDALVRAFDRLIMKGQAYIGVVRRYGARDGVVYLRGEYNAPRESIFKETFLSLLYDEPTETPESIRAVAEFFTEAAALESRTTQPSIHHTLETVKNLNHAIQHGLEKKVFDAKRGEELQQLLGTIDTHTSVEDVAFVSSLVLTNMIDCIDAKIRSLN